MPAQLAGLSTRWLLVFWAATALGLALAQQPNAPSAAKSDTASQGDAVANTTDPPTEEATEAMFPHFKDTRFWLSGQANFIFQTHLPFHAAYSGLKSLSPNYEKATSRVMTLYTGVRLNNSTEFLVDIEEAGGAALSTGLGLAGDTNLDIVRNPSLSKAPYLGRGIIHKVFDTRGYTVGVTADYEDRNWGFRFAEGLMPKVANGIDLVWNPWQAHAENFEYELRHGVLPKKPGVIRLLAFTNYANMGIYRQAIANFEAGLTPVPEITNHPWHITRKYGFGINLEQNLTRNLTAFARFGWDNGKTESFAYTEVDQTFAGGVGASGAWWRRKQDRAGFALVSNAIKKDHQMYLADGGLGFLLGDGKLNYGRENILETYYTVHVWRGIYLAPGLQHIVNPGYNRDRGPVLVPAFRAHIEF